MKQTAIVVAPGRGTYNAPELGYLNRHHSDKNKWIDRFDDYRRNQGQTTLRDLDGADRFGAQDHTRGDNASALIHACAYLDFMSINRDRFDILGVTGNSMGWYIALACGGAMAPLHAMTMVNTMGTLMHTALIGGQLVYPVSDASWLVIPGRREAVLLKTAEINARSDHCLALSIDLGGMLVLAGDEAGLRAFEAEMPVVQDRFPMRLRNHAAFHTELQAPVAEMGRARLPVDMFVQPELPLIDGRGAIWYPHSSDLAALWSYTLAHQVVRPYDFAGAIRTAAREFMPDVFIVLGPGTTLGGAVAQSLVRAGWRGWNSKADFTDTQNALPRLLAMGHPDQRDLVTSVQT